MLALARTTLALSLISAVTSTATDVFKPAHSPALCAALKQLSSPPRRFSPWTGAYQYENPVHVVYGPISEWDTSRVTDMSRAFAHASFFNAGEGIVQETERQRDRETERQRDRETERQSDRETERGWLSGAGTARAGHCALPKGRRA